MLKTDKERYDDAVAYLATRVPLFCIIAFFGSPHNARDTSGLDYCVTTMRDDCRCRTG